MAYSVNISVEAPIENQIQEITYDGQEIYQAYVNEFSCQQREYSKDARLMELLSAVKYVLRLIINPSFIEGDKISYQFYFINYATDLSPYRRTWQKLLKRLTLVKQTVRR